MKSRFFLRSLAAVVSVAWLVPSAPDAAAQNSFTPTPTPATGSASPPATVALAPGVADVLRLAQAKIGDDTIVAFIDYARTSYDLSASEIVQLRALGVSDRVLAVMLHQRQKLTTEAAATASAPAKNAGASAPQYAANYLPPANPYVQAAPADASASTVYVIPNSSAAYSYPYNGYYPYYGGYYGYSYPGLSFAFGFGSGYCGGGYYGGRYYGGNCYRGGYYYGNGYRGNYYGGGYRGAGYQNGPPAGAYRGGAGYANGSAVGYRGGGNMGGAAHGGGGAGRHR